MRSVSNIAYFIPRLHIYFI